jgi:hypothetical protein
MANLELFESLAHRNYLTLTPEFRKKNGLGGTSGQKKHVIKTKPEKSKIKKSDSKTKKTDETKKEKKKSKSKKVGDSKTKKEKSKKKKKKPEKSKIKKRDSKTRRRLDKNRKEKTSKSKKREKETKNEKPKSKKRSLIKEGEKEEDDISSIKKRRLDENKTEKKKSKKRAFNQKDNNIIPFEEQPLEIIHLILSYIENTDFSTLLNLMVSKSFFQTFIKPRIETTIVTLLYISLFNSPQYPQGVKKIEIMDPVARKKALEKNELELLEFYFDNDDLYILSKFFIYYSGGAMPPRDCSYIDGNLVDHRKNVKTLNQFMSYLGGVIEYSESNKEDSETLMFIIKHYSNIMYTLSLFSKEIINLYPWVCDITGNFNIRNIIEEPLKNSYIKDIFYLTKEKRLIPLKKLKKVKVLCSSLNIKLEYKNYIMNTEKNEALRTILLKPYTNYNTPSNYANMCNLLMSNNKLEIRDKKKDSDSDLFNQVMIKNEEGQYINIFSKEAKDFRGKCFLYDYLYNSDPNITYKLYTRYETNHTKNSNILKDLYTVVKGCHLTRTKLNDILLKLKNEMPLYSIKSK